MQAIVFRNLTPHPLAVMAEDGTILHLAKCSKPARCVNTPQTLPSLSHDNKGYRLAKSSFGAVEELPVAVPGIILITSALVADMVKRPDVVSPGELLRDSEGRVIGCNGFASYA